MILIAIGANLPDAHGRSARVNCAAAVEALRGLPGLRLQTVSRWYSTAPVPTSEQPDYVNGVVRLHHLGDVTLDPALLLRRLQAIEARAGRIRGAVNAARPLDLDIIAIDDIVRAAPDPVLPHPRAHLRNFVLLPLADVAPDWRHPVLHRSAVQLLEPLEPAGISMLI